MVATRCLLAAFDQAHLNSDGTYWSWRHADLTLDILDAFYYDFAAKHWPTLDTPPEESFRGGCARVDARWLCWYRFLEGGRDKVGRPGRYVVVAAFVESSSGDFQDCLGLLQSPFFDALALQARTECPIRAPENLEFPWESARIQPDSASAAKLQKDGQIVLTVDTASDDVWPMCAAISSTHRFDCFIVQGGARSSISVGIVELDGHCQAMQGSRPSIDSPKTCSPDRPIRGTRLFHRIRLITSARKLPLIVITCVTLALAIGFTAYKWYSDSQQGESPRLQDASDSAQVISEPTSEEMDRQ